MREQEYRVPRAHGPKVAVIGGGHGLSNMLRGLKQYTENISAIVTVADDGGGSGMLRQDLGMPPPGDIRSCMEALANTEPVMRELLHYRFTEGSLAGQSFGNLFLAALNGISPSFDAAVRRMSQVLAITGRVLPVTTADVQLEAEFENGATGVFVTSTADLPGTNRLELTMECGKLVCDGEKLELYKLDVNEREFCFEAENGFAYAEPHYSIVETDGENPQHIGVLNAFAGKILHGTPLVAEGREGIRGLTLSNAMHLSSWLNRMVEIPFDEDLYYEELQKRVATSQAKSGEAVYFSTEGTYGTR